jgi:ABC-type branched-subunit amino acid transport system ATPase component
MTQPLLQVEKLTKTFGGLMALSDLSFSVASGEIVGLIGPNGSGKSTAFNLITGAFPPTAGKVMFLGEWGGAHLSVGQTLSASDCAAKCGGRANVRVRAHHQSPTG